MNFKLQIIHRLIPFSSNFEFSSFSLSCQALNFTGIAFLSFWMFFKYPAQKFDDLNYKKYQFFWRQKKIGTCSLTYPNGSKQIEGAYLHQ